MSFERTALIARKKAMGLKTDIRSRRAASPKVRTPRARPQRQADDPLYLQVVRALKDEIVSGVFPIGSQLPTEEELCERFSVSRYTVREALRRLREDSLVSSRQGAGTTVVPPRPANFFVHEVMSINDLVAFADRRPVCDRYYRDDRDRRQTLGAHRDCKRRAMARRARLSPHRGQRASGVLDRGLYQPRIRRRSAGCCSGTAARSSI